MKNYLVGLNFNGYIQADSAYEAELEFARIHKINRKLLFAVEDKEEGWHCETSPTFTCDYHNPDTGEYNEDCCIYCGEPYERK